MAVLSGVAVLSASGHSGVKVIFFLIIFKGETHLERTEWDTAGFSPPAACGHGSLWLLLPARPDPSELWWEPCAGHAALLLLLKPDVWVIGWGCN